MGSIEHSKPYLVEGQGALAVARATTVCPDCGDSGFVSHRDDNGYRVMRPCHCRALARRITLFNQAGVPALFAGCSLDTFRPSNERLGDAHAAASEMTQNFALGARQGLLLMGPVGVGKTHLAVAIVRKLTLDMGISCRFVDFLQLLQDLKASYEKRAGTADLLEPLGGVDVLVIDDLGKGRGSDWEGDVLDDLVSRRYNSGGTTVATTNFRDRDRDTSGSSHRNAFAHETLAQRVGDRIYSRLRAMCQFVEVDGDDFRQSRAGRARFP